MPFLFFLGATIFGVPMITAFCAHRFGRPFWKWFAIGCVLPLVSVFIVLMLPEQQQEKQF
ncbi:MAG: hypothetical protein NT084_09990 [Bacteroidetes bacterium]|nr:hypothetical protein [Bacteroidota bacterium]